MLASLFASEATRICKQPVIAEVDSIMSKERENKAIADRWLDGFWGNSWTPKIVEDLAAVDILIQFSLQVPRRGREEAKKFLVGIHDAFPDLEFDSAVDLIADGEYVFGPVAGGGTHAGSAFADLLIGFLPAHSRRMMHLTGKPFFGSRTAKSLSHQSDFGNGPRFRKATAYPNDDSGYANLNLIQRGSK